MLNKIKILHEIVMYILNNISEVDKMKKRRLACAGYNPPLIYHHYLGKSYICDFESNILFYED